MKAANSIRHRTIRIPCSWSAGAVASMLLQSVSAHRRPFNWQGDNFLSLDRNLIQCSLHGALFRIQDGVCVWGPCVRQRLAAVRIAIEHGSLVLLPD